MNIDAIFNAFHKLGSATHLTHEYQLKKEQVRSVNVRECGNCDHWMKSTCIPEKQHRQFKSMGSPACGAFTLSPQSKRLSDEFTIELTDIGKRITALSEDAGI